MPMSKPPSPYTRLTRSAPAVGSYRSLWLADDHLLIVNSNGYTEDYRRLQFRDVQGFFLCPSDRRLWWALPWGTVAIVSGVAAGIFLSRGATPVFSTMVLVLSSLILLWNHLLGPGCRVYVVTGVQTGELPSLVRRGKTERILRRLQPLIETAQADLASRPADSTTLMEPVMPPLS